MGSLNPESSKAFSLCGYLWRIIRDMPKQSWAKTLEFARASKKLGQDDPRRIVHSLKVGLALTLVSFVYYLQPLYHSLGNSNAIWAVITVVVIMEFSVGATLGKGLNRIMATLLGAYLGFAVQWIANTSGDKWQAVLTSFFVFVLGAIMTFLRFVPEVKAKYEYGLTIFILTLSLVSVSGYREDKMLKMACDRVLTIILGSFIAMTVCIFIFPVWIGDDLHYLVASNIDKLGHFLQEFGERYFSSETEDGKPGNIDRSLKEKYESVLTSKTREETMANLARWEPSHGQFRFLHPWKQYLKIGNLTRQCANKIEALDFYLTSETHQTGYEVRMKIKESCQYISSECGKALKELSSEVKRMSSVSTSKDHIERAKEGVEMLNSVIESNPWEGFDVMDIVPAAAVASLLTNLVSAIETISQAVQQLVSMAHFRTTCPENSLFVCSCV